MTADSGAASIWHLTLSDDLVHGDGAITFWPYAV